MQGAQTEPNSNGIVQAMQFLDNDERIASIKRNGRNEDGHFQMIKFCNSKPSQPFSTSF